MYLHRYLSFSYTYSIPFQKTPKIKKKYFAVYFLLTSLLFYKTDVTQRKTLPDGLTTKTTRPIPGPLEPNHNLIVLHNPMKQEFITMNPLSHEIKSTLP